MAIVPTNSVLLDLNSRFATKDPLWQNGRFTCTVNNGSRITSCVKVLPHRCTLANVFPNVPTGASLLLYTQDDTDPTLPIKTILQLDIPSKFYTRDEFIALFPANAAISYDANTQKFTLNVTTDYVLLDQTETLYIQASDKKILHLMGFTQFANLEETIVKVSNPFDTSNNSTYLWRDENDDVDHTTTLTKGRYTTAQLATALNAVTDDVAAPGRHVWSAPPTDDPTKFAVNSSDITSFWTRRLSNGNLMADVLGITVDTQYSQAGPFALPNDPQLITYQLTGASPINFSGENFVHIAIRELAQSNLISSTNYNYNILTTVPLHTTQYGDYVTLKSDDLFVDDVDFPRHIDAGTVEVAILDASYQQLYIPPNYNVNVQLKAYHIDTLYSGAK